MTVSALDGISGCLLLSSFFSFPYWPSLCSLHILEKVQIRSQLKKRRWRVKPHLRITSASLLMVPPSVKGLSQPSNSLPMGLQHNVDLYSTPGPEGANLRVKEDSSLGKRTSVSSSLLYEASPSLLKVTRIVAEPTRPTTRKAPTSPLKQLHQQEQCACPVTANLERPLHPHCKKYLSPFRCLPHPI